MATHQYRNQPSTTLTGAVTAGASAISVASGAAFPPQGKFTIIVDSEIMLVTGVSGTTWTVTRGHDGTSAAAHNNNATVAQILTVDSFLNADHFDVRAFGALGNGSTNDLPAFDAATAAAKAAGGGTIFVPDGDYLLGDSWNIDVDRIHVELSANAAIFTDGPTSAGHTLAFIGGGTSLGVAVSPQNTVASIRGGRVYNLNSGAADNAIGFVRYKNAKCYDVHVPSADRKAITAQYGVDNIDWQGNVIDAVGADAITVEGGCDVVRIVGNTVGSAVGRGILVLGDANLVTNAIVEDNSVYSTDTGIWVANTTRPKISDNFVDSGARGITVVNGSSADIHGNTISAAGQQPIFVDAVATALRIDGNTIVSITGAANTYDAIYMEDMTCRPMVNNNYIASTNHKYVINAVNMAAVAGIYMGNRAGSGATGTYGGTAPILAANLIGGAVSSVGL